MTRSPYDDPNVKDALAEGRPASDIWLIQCQACGTYGYYNQGSHFNCSADGCDFYAAGRAMDVIIDNGEVITLDDWTGMQVADEDVP